MRKYEISHALSIAAGVLGAAGALALGGCGQNKEPGTVKDAAVANLLGKKNGRSSSGDSYLQ